MNPEAMNHLNRITYEPGKLGGKACVRGHRIPAEQVLGFLAAGMSEQEIFEDFPELDHDDILAVLQWALAKYKPG